MALVDYEVKGRIGYITMNRPDKFNAINLEMADNFVSAIDKAVKDSDVLVVIVSGKGRGFCSGADLEGVTPEFLSRTEKIYIGLIELDKPTIVAVHGSCLAQGICILFCCDIRIAAEGTRFGWPHVTHGIMSMGGTATAPHILPRNFAYEYLFTGELFSTEECSRFNIVNRVVPEDKLMSTAEEIGKRICQNAPLAVQATKKAAKLGLEMNFKQRIGVSRMVFTDLRSTRDAQEGIDAFLQKRKPVWKEK